VVAVLAAGLHVGGDGAGVVVGFHDDEAGAEGDEEAEDGALPGAADTDSSGWSEGLHDGGHGYLPYPHGHALGGAQLWLWQRA